MSKPQTFRVLVRTGQVHAIDIAAKNEKAALQRAERLWCAGHAARFVRIDHRVTPVFEIDEDATHHLADVANEHRARWAASALKVFSSETGSDMGQEALHDLLCDLGHYADELGLDFEAELQRAAETWAEEKVAEVQS